MKYDIPAILVAAKQAWKFRHMRYPDDCKEDRQSNVKTQTLKCEFKRKLSTFERNGLLTSVENGLCNTEAAKRGKGFGLDGGIYEWQFSDD